ncbi:alpha/beta fold hydrolase [Chloroflexota bacterium]
MSILTTNQIKMNYQITGDGDPLVLIHGLGSSGRDWEYQLDVFARKFKVITMDLRGHGNSDKPKGPYSMAMFAQDIAGLLIELQEEPAHVVGLSLGGGIAFQLALDHPDLVKTLTIVNSFPELMIRSFKDRLNTWQRFAIVKLLGMKKMGEILSERLFPKEEHGEIRELFVQRWAENDPRAYQASMQAMIGWSVVNRLDSIKCPTLIIAADNDYSSVESKQEYTKLIPGAELVIIQDSRHATPVEHPEKFNKLLWDFLSKQ